MNEARRQSCLSHMGVTLWYARGPLPGAASSPSFDFQRAIPAPAPAQPSRGVSSTIPAPQISKGSDPADRAPSRQSLQSVMAALEGGEASAESASEAPSAMAESPTVASSETAIQSVPATSTRNHRLHAAFCAGSRLNMAVDLSTEVSESMQLALAGNIARALGESLAEPRRVTWPVFINPEVPGNDDEGLVQVGNRILATMPQRPWLVLGGQATAFFHLLASHSGGPVIWLASPDDLRSLAGDGAKKRALWKKLQQQSELKPVVES